MTTGDTLRHWALVLRAMLEQADKIRIVVEDDTVSYEYVRGRGLRVEIVTGEGRHPETHELPEEALDEERWVVAA